MMAFGTGLISVYNSTSCPWCRTSRSRLAPSNTFTSRVRSPWVAGWSIFRRSPPWVPCTLRRRLALTRARCSARSSRGGSRCPWSAQRSAGFCSGSGWESRVSIMFAAPVQRLIRARPDRTSPAWPALYSGARVFVDRCRDANDKVFGRDAERLKRSSWPPGSSTTPHRLPVRHVRRRDCGGTPAAALRTCRTARRQVWYNMLGSHARKRTVVASPATSMAGDCGRKWYAVRHATCSRYAERCPLTTDRRHAGTGCALSRSPASTAC